MDATVALLRLRADSGGTGRVPLPSSPSSAEIRMALSLAQKDALTTDDGLLARTRQAVRQHAAFLIALPGTAAQVEWAHLMVGSNNRAGQVAADLAGRLTTDPAVADSTLGDGSDVTDSSLQGAVDVICEEYR